MRKLRGKSDVTDLKLERAAYRIGGHEVRLIRHHPSLGFDSSSGAGSPGRALQHSRATLRLPAAADLHGLCATDLEREFVRHRGMLEHQRCGRASFESLADRTVDVAALHPPGRLRHYV